MREAGTLREAAEQKLPQGWTSTKLSAIVEPRTSKMDPRAMPMRLFGTIPAASVKSNANVLNAGDVFYGRLRPYLNKVHQPDFDGLCSSEFMVFPETIAMS